MAEGNLHPIDTDLLVPTIECSFLGVGGCSKKCNLIYYLENAGDIRNNEEHNEKRINLLKDAAKHGCQGAIELLNEIEKGDTKN